MALVGYARVSTAEQVYGLEAQLRDLRATGCTRLFSEQVSSVAQRDQLEAALDWVREGDCLCTVRLDRLARSTSDLLNIIARLEAKGVACQSAFNRDPLSARKRDPLAEMLGG